MGDAVHGKDEQGYLSKGTSQSIRSFFLDPRARSQFCSEPALPESWTTATETAHADEYLHDCCCLSALQVSSCGLDGSPTPTQAGQPSAARLSVACRRCRVAHPHKVYQEIFPPRESQGTVQSCPRRKQLAAVRKQTEPRYHREGLSCCIHTSGCCRNGEHYRQIWCTFGESKDCYLGYMYACGCITPSGLLPPS